MAAKPEQNRNVLENSSANMAIFPHPNPLRSLIVGQYPCLSSFDQVTPVMVSCGLLKILPPKNQGIAIKFIEKLVARHTWIEHEREILRAEVRGKEARICQIIREMSILEASPYAWLALETEEFDYHTLHCVRKMIKQIESGTNLFCEDS